MPRSNRSIWRGAISFGIVSIPVRLFTATEDKAEGMAAFIEKRPGVWQGK